MISLCQPGVFKAVVDRLIEEGYGKDIEWSENVKAPASSEAFAQEAIFVIANSGMKHTIARTIYQKSMQALTNGKPVFEVFRHAGKAKAMETIWYGRDQLFEAFLAHPDPVAFCGSLPFIGEITKFHLAKNFGADVAKPDVHLERLAARENMDVAGLCTRLASESGYRIATVDVLLWRACAIGLIDSRSGNISPAVRLPEKAS